MTRIEGTRADPIRPVWILLALVCRTALTGIGIVSLIADDIAGLRHVGPGVLSVLAGCDILLIVAPLLRWRISPLIAGTVTPLVHHAASMGHQPFIWDPWYLGIAMVLLTIPRRPNPAPESSQG